MNAEDRRMVSSARDASPERWSSTRWRAAEAPMSEEIEEPREAPDNKKEDPSQTDSALASPISARRSFHVSRMPTQRDEVSKLERHPTAISRIQTGRSQHESTIAAGLRSRTITRQNKAPMPNFGAGKPFPPPLPDREEYVVEFDGPNDPLHAQNWPAKKKIPIAVLLCFTTWVASFGSAVWSPVIKTVAEDYHISSEVGILGTSLFVLGFATGPALWAPSSELYGRKWPIIISCFGSGVFNVAVAAAKDLQTIFICRFFAGFFGACPVTIVAAVFADMFDNRQRGVAISFYGMTVLAGPSLAGSIGGFIVDSYLGWRWVQYLTAILALASLVLNLLILKETYPPIILANKAADLRRRTKNWGIHAKQEEIEIDFNELVEKNLSRPLKMLFTEPIVLLLTIYVSFLYGLLYLLLGFYPIVFEQIHGFNRGQSGLTFLGLLVGEMLSAAYLIACVPSYNRKLVANNNRPVPEWRMPQVIVGGVVFALGLFWFAWTGWKRDIQWAAPTVAGVFIGFGILTVFLQSLNYLIDAYLMFAASAIAANTVLRSLAGAGFPLFATYMIDGMGVQWAGTLLGCVSLVLVPVPVLFLLRGAKIREKSAFAPTLPAASRASDALSSGSDVEKEAESG